VRRGGPRRHELGVNEVDMVPVVDDLADHGLVERLRDR
jgi:hypothetical protein